MACLNFDDARLQNTVSVLFALECVADGISLFIENEFKIFHGRLKATMSYLKQSSCTSINVSNNPCSKLFSKPKDLSSWCVTCLSWRNTILSSHKNGYKIGKHGTDWSAIDSSKWPTEPKEVEKCFHPDWSNSMKSSGPNLSDIALLLDKIMNCQDIRQIFLNSVDPARIKEIRNKVHHSENITPDTKETYCQDMLDFLQTPNVWAYPQAKEAYNKVKIFKEKSYAEVIKDRIIEEHELNKMRERISLSWGKCKTASIASIFIMFASVLVSVLCVGFIEIVKYPYFAELFQILIGIFSINSIEGLVQCDNVTFVTRNGWSARSPKLIQYMQTPVDIVLVHNTAGKHCYNKVECSNIARSIQNFHMDGNNWDDVGYNFLIGEDGRVYEGRGWDKVGAHTKGWNDVSISFAFFGNFNNKRPDAVSLNTLNNTIMCGVRNGYISKNYVLFGHRDKRPTDSPGHFLYEEIKSFDHFHNPHT